MNTTQKESCSWGSVDLWSEGSAVDNSVIVTHGKLPVSPPGELSTYPWTLRLWLLLLGAAVNHQPGPTSNRNILNTTKQARRKTVPTPYRASAWMSHNQVVSPSPCVPRGSALGADPRCRVGLLHDGTEALAGVLAMAMEMRSGGYRNLDTPKRPLGNILQCGRWLVSFISKRTLDRCPSSSRV